MSESRPVDEELSSTSFSPEDVLSIENIVPIVGIGASAGGLDAFRQLLANLPESTGMAFVLVQHLDPIHESHLSEILSRMTKMPVREAESGLEVLPNHIYVIPPGMTLTLSHGALQLAPRTEKRGLHLPIDIFFRSLAEHNRGKAIGVILSGTGSDGALGLEEIKSSGGITFAQDPLSATHDGMPKSAIDEGLADFILPPAGIANELARIGGQDNPFLNPDDVEKDSDWEGFSALLGLLKTKMNVDFTQYRDSTLKRRIQRRMTLRHLHTVAEYVQLLGADPVEIEALYQDILINVTRFFRDPEVFESLKTAVFPEILKGKSPDAPIRIWVTGCSSGQEAYTVAMVLLEFLADLPRPPTIQIFASDLKEASALAKARLGCYPENIEADVSPERLQKFFTKEDKGYQIRKNVRDLCVFAKHDLIADPPFSHVDLVTCRNVLIYMSSDLQRRIMPIFHYALNQGGFLLLGSSETVGRDSDLFTIVDRSHRIYRRNPAASRPPHFLLKQNASIAVPPTFQHGLVPVTQADFRREADRILLNRFPPACVLVNADLDILQFRGRTRPYLEPAQGAASFNLLKMANDSLFLELRAAVQDAQSRKTVIEKMDVRVRNEGEIKAIRLEVIPVTVPISKETCFLILFHEDSPTKPSVPGSMAMAVAGATGGPVGPGSEDAHAANAASRDEAYSLLNEKAKTEAAQAADELARLRQETSSLREYLQSIREQHDGAIEELKSSGEEILSSNEELQSTNEELETAKEEYQSANEELTTVNEEMSQRNQEMGRLNNDLNNLLNSINVPIVIVGADLRIRRFTATAEKDLHLIATDVGRPLGDLQWDFTDPDLGKAVLEVVSKAAPRDYEVRNREGRWQSLRIHPYRTSEGRIDGAVIILMDIDVLKTFQDKLQYAEEYARSIVTTAREPMLILRNDMRINTANASYYKLFHTTPEESEGQPLFKPGETRWSAPGLRELVEGCLLRDGAFDGFEFIFEDPVTGRRTLLLNGRALLREPGMARMVLLSMEDITERKRVRDFLKVESSGFEEAVRERTAQLQASNEEMEVFSYSVSHDLRSPLRAIRGYAEALLEDFGDQADEGAKDYIRKIIQSGSRMDRLILDVLTYSRTALAEVHIHRIDLDSLINDVIRQHPDLESPGITLTVESPLLPVMGHESSLAQCLSNLLLNAVKFVPAGKAPSIRVRTEPVGNDVRLWIEDNGIGIDREHHERIFGMFEKLNVGDTYAGTGIGLAIVKKSIERMGGKVGIESELNQGSRFWLQLPKEHLPKEQDPQEQVPEQIAPPDPHAGHLAEDKSN